MLSDCPHLPLLWPFAPLLLMLSGHFQADHHPCPHPACLERKFVVFAEEQDLKRHFATEHGSEMNMSRAQRRQVMSARGRVCVWVGGGGVRGEGCIWC
jgi:hypothetical protein